MLKMIGIALCCAGVLLAEGVTVPLQDPSRPAKVNVHVMNGNITVRGANITHVLVEARSSSGTNLFQHLPESVDGMKRLDIPGNSGLNITENSNVVNIGGGPLLLGGLADLTITVPLHSSLQLSGMSGGGIDVEHVDGEVDANELSGNITLKHVDGPIVAHSLNGEIVAILDRLDSSKPSSFSTMNGNIDVTLPADAKADLRMKTDNGAVYSDFDVNLGRSNSVIETGPGHMKNGKYRVRFNRVVRGAINGGGPELQFTTFNGQIYIRKAK
ncbi:MAG: hypothetical protein ACRD3Y_02025 [Bryobacteraceae bacterium]